METVAELKHFYFAYKKNNLVLHDIDFKIEKGSFTVIAGPSGSGKTTLCKAMAGIVPFYMGGAYSGEVMVLGESTKGKKVSDIAMRLGLMLEDYESQLVSLTAGEEVAFSLSAGRTQRRAAPEAAFGFGFGGASGNYCFGRACIGYGPGRSQFAVQAALQNT